MSSHKNLVLILALTIWLIKTESVQGQLKIAQLKYDGGGDWYANKTGLPNLINFTNQVLNTDIEPVLNYVEPSDPALFSYPYIYMTGHGNVVFSEKDADNLRRYLLGGGFLHIDDNYGLDPYIRIAIKKVFPNIDFVELPFNHPIYHQKYDFKYGLPKIHEHDGKPSQGLGIIYENKLVVFYSYECDLGNGWEDVAAHNNTEKKRTEALQMGANIITYAFESQRKTKTK